MAKYKSRGGKPETQAEGRLQAVKFIFFWLLVVAVIAVGVWWMFYKAPWNDPDNLGPQTNATQECSEILDRSVFSTGSPLLDQRILWAIVNDESQDRTATEALVTHIWKNGNFNFEDAGAKTLWADATAAVPEVDGAIDKPALMITTTGVIVPFSDVEETQSIQWAEVNVSAPSTQRTTFITSSTAGEQQSASVPTVLLSINGGTTVPTPTLGTASEHVAVGAKEVCE